MGHRVVHEVVQFQCRRQPSAGGSGGRSRRAGGNPVRRASAGSGAGRCRRRWLDAGSRRTCPTRPARPGRGWRRSGWAREDRASSRSSPWTGCRARRGAPVGATRRRRADPPLTGPGRCSPAEGDAGGRSLCRLPQSPPAPRRGRTLFARRSTPGPEARPLRRAVDGDRHEQGEEHRVARHLQAEVHERLHGEGRDAGHGADP